MNFVERWDDFAYWVNTVLFRGIRWRAPHTDSKAEFIGEIWASDTIARLGLIDALRILVSPNYPHLWRRGFGWWHRWNCYPCAEAKVKWPEARRKMLVSLRPFQRDLPVMPTDRVDAWVQEEIDKLEVAFKPIHGAKRDCIAEQKPHHLCERAPKPCAAGHNSVQCCLCNVRFCRWVVDHKVYFEDWEE